MLCLLVLKNLQIIKKIVLRTCISMISSEDMVGVFSKLLKKTESFGGAPQAKTSTGGKSEASAAQPWLCDPHLLLPAPPQRTAFPCGWSSAVQPHERILSSSFFLCTSCPTHPIRFAASATVGHHSDQHKEETRGLTR